MIGGVQQVKESELLELQKILNLYESKIKELQMENVELKKKIGQLEKSSEIPSKEETTETKSINNSEEELNGLADKIKTNGSSSKEISEILKQLWKMTENKEYGSIAENIIYDIIDQNYLDQENYEYLYELIKPYLNSNKLQPKRNWTLMLHMLESKNIPTEIAAAIIEKIFSIQKNEKYMKKNYYMCKRLKKTIIKFELEEKVPKWYKDMWLGSE